MKKSICICLLAIILICSCGCRDSVTKDDGITIVTTVFPEFDWTREILGDERDVKLILLTENGADLHSYQPTVADVAAIASADLLIYTGGVSSQWIEDVLKDNPASGRMVIRLMDLLADDEKLTEQSHHHNAEHHDDEYDEHVWLSLKLAARFCDTICDAICHIIPEKENEYRKNCESYTEKLKELDERYGETVSAASVNTLLFADRFPFSYLTNDYGIECYAAFPGCSAETEASFETIAFLAQTLDSNKLPAIVVLENSDQTIATTVRSTASSQNAVILTMNSLQSVTKSAIADGVTYLEMMHENLAALEIALGCED